jgi:hypothetical protein
MLIYFLVEINTSNNRHNDYLSQGTWYGSVKVCILNVFLQYTLSRWGYVMFV